MTAPARWLALVCCVHLVAAAPAGAASLRFWSPEVGGEFVAHELRLDGDSSEAGAQAPLAVYVLDGDRDLTGVAAAVRGLQARGDLPPLVLVGLSRGRRQRLARLRDYTPSRIAEVPISGGAEAFLGFLAGRLLPALEARWQGPPEERILVGHSLGALFALYALARRPGAFGGVLAASPSLWWDGGRALDWADELRRPARPPARVYLSTGSLEGEENVARWQDFAARLSAPAAGSLEVRADLLPGRAHGDAKLPAYEAGLPWLATGAGAGETTPSTSE